MTEATLRCPSCKGGNMDGKGGWEKGKGPYFEDVGCRDCGYITKGIRMYLWDMIRGDNNRR